MSANVALPGWSLTICEARGTSDSSRIATSSSPPEPDAILLANNHAQRTQPNGPTQRPKKRVAKKTTRKAHKEKNHTVVWLFVWEKEGESPFSLSISHPQIQLVPVPME